MLTLKPISGVCVCVEKYNAIIEISDPENPYSGTWLEFRKSNRSRIKYVMRNSESTNPPPPTYTKKNVDTLFNFSTQTSFLASMGTILNLGSKSEPDQKQMQFKKGKEKII